jgi:Xaa-Pro aminopeptidase
LRAAVEPADDERVLAGDRASLALADPKGRVIVLAPQDEAALAHGGWADEVRTFEPASLHDLRTASTAIVKPLGDAARDMGLGGRIGYEAGPAVVPAPYVGMHLYGADLPRLLNEAIANSLPVAADDILGVLRSVPTDREAARIRSACHIAQRAFEQHVLTIHAGLTEDEAAGRIEPALASLGIDQHGAARAGGRVFCMSGPNAADAYAAFQISRDRRLQPGDLVLVHCNSYAEGFFTDVTRTYCLGEPTERQRRLYDAVFAARAAALAAIRPGVSGGDVDRAAREALAQRGFGQQFKNPTGHGVGFAAIDHNALPRLHPASHDVLREGMVFNVEPAIYIPGECGLRHCDMMRVTASGAEVLTPFHGELKDMVIGKT